MSSSPTASRTELSATISTARGQASRWIIVVAAIVIVGFGVGALFSLAVFLKPMQESMGWSRTAISAVALWMWVAYGTGSLMWGVLSDRWGARRVVVTGGILLGLGLVASSRITSLWQLYLAFGGIVGVAAGAFYAPLTTTATRWFTANRGLAVALVSAGTGLGTFMVAPLTRWLISSYDWRLAMLILGDIVWLVIIPLGLLVRDAPRAAASATDLDVPLARIFRSPQFWLIAVTHFTCCVAHSGPIFHMVTHAMDQGIPGMAAATLLGVSGLSSLIGRVVSGIVADRWGSKPTLIVMLGAQVPAIFLYLFTSSVTGFYALAILFGASYGGVMPMYALLTREYFGARAMGTAYGAIFMLQAIGMGLGAYGGGWFHDHLGTYAWLFGVATAAAAVAILFALPLRSSHRIIMAARAAA
jgi:predicted MFS family arabinose efflux permease